MPDDDSGDKDDPASYMALINGTLLPAFLDGSTGRTKKRFARSDDDPNDPDDPSLLQWASFNLICHARWVGRKCRMTMPMIPASCTGRPLILFAMPGGSTRNAG